MASLSVSRVYFIHLILALAPTGTWGAADLCPRLFTQLVQVPQSTTKLTAEEYERHLQELTGKLKGFKSPKFGVYLGVDEPFYLPETNTIFAPSGYFRSQVSGKRHPATYELAILDHEIGHALYETNFPYPGLGIPMKERVRARVASDLAAAEQAIEQARSAPLDLEAKTQLLRKAQEEASGHYVRYQAFRRSEWAIEGFRELFSDLHHRPPTAPRRGERRADSSDHGRVWPLSPGKSAVSGPLLRAK